MIYRALTCSARLMAASGAAPLAPERSITRVLGRAGPISIHSYSHMQADTMHAQSVLAMHTTHVQLFTSCHRDPTSYDGSLVSVSVFFLYSPPSVRA